MGESKAKVAVVMGSDSDLPSLKGAFEILEKFQIPYVARIISAHRTPAEAAKFASSAEGDGVQVIVCAAGMAAHLAGVVAAHTILPVIGIPMPCEPFNALDSLFSTVNMPPGVPVATVSAGKAGGTNAALLAVSMLALADKELGAKLKEFRQRQSDKVRKADTEVMDKIKAML